MGFASTTIWEVQTGGSDSANGGGFDVGNASMATDLAATVATGTAPIVTSASYNFTTRDNGAWLFIKAGTNWTPGWYKIASTGSNAATLDGAIGHAVLFEGGAPNRLNTVAGCATTASPTGGTWSIDYSQSATPGIAFTDMVIDGTTNTKFTSTLNPVGVNMVGNTIAVTSGTGFTVQTVQIASVSGTTATCDKSLGTLSSTGGNGGLGGALASPGMASTNFVAQNSMWIKSGTYNLSNTANGSGGKVQIGVNGIAGAQQWIAGYGSIRADYGTKPILKATANNVTCIRTIANFCRIVNLEFQRDTSTGIKGFWNDDGSNIIVDRCKANGLDNAGISLDFNTGHVVIACEVVNCNPGGSAALTLNGATNSRLIDCYVHGGGGVHLGANQAYYTLVTGNAAYGFIGTLNSSASHCVSWGNTTGTGNGFYQIGILINCIAYNNGSNDFGTGGAGSYRMQGCAGPAIGTGYLAADYSPFEVIDYQTLTTDPFTNAAGGDFTLNSTAGGGAAIKNLGYPSTLPTLSPTSYPTAGVYQPQAATPGGCPHLAGIGGGLAG